MILQKHKTWDINDPTKIKQYMSCPRKYFYEYVLGWRTISPNIHFIFGDAWHKAIEHLMLTSYTDLEVIRAYDGKFLPTFRKDIPADMDEIYSPKTPANALKALGQYIDVYKRDKEKYEVLYTEIAGSTSITEDTVVYWRMDSIVREREGDKKVLSLDHKTSGRNITSSWRSSWDLDIQMATYTHNLYCLYPFEEVKGVKVNGAFFLKTKLNFERVPVYRNKESMQFWLWNTIYYMDCIKRDFALLEDATDSDPVLMTFPMNTESCGSWAGCIYKDFCTTWPNPLRNCEAPPLGFKVEHWNPMDKESTHKMEGLS